MEISYYRVIETKCKEYSVGDYVVGPFGWVTHAISSQKHIKLDSSIPADMHSTGVGVLGMPG